MIFDYYVTLKYTLHMKKPEVTRHLRVKKEIKYKGRRVVQISDRLNYFN